jgi:hypothetical protein
MIRNRRAKTRVARRNLACVACLTAGVASPGGAGAQEIPAAARARLQPALQVALSRVAPEDSLSVVVQYHAPAVGPADPAGVVPSLQVRAATALMGLDATRARAGGELRVIERLWIVPAALVVATPAGIAALAEDTTVARVYLDDQIRVQLEPSAASVGDPSFTSPAMRTIGADAVWDRGVTGEGTVVAFFDSGVDSFNAMLASRWRGRRTTLRASWFDPFVGASVPQDPIGHGTQVAVSAVGALPAGDTLRFSDGSLLVAASGIDVVTGPAPRAEWIAARVFARFGGQDYTRRSVLLQAFQWALDPDGDPGTADAPNVINNSWGLLPGAEGFDPCTDVLYDAIDAAEAAGVAVLFAAGNFGPEAGSVTPPGARDDPTLRSPAVGATTGTGDDIAVANGSGRGPSPCAGGIKPEIVAPGTVPVVVSATASSARLTGFTVSGTSFAVSQVSGALALVLQVRPSAGPEEAKRILLDTAVDVPPSGPDNDTGYGLLDVPAAVQRANPSFAGGLLQASLTRRTMDSVHVAITNRGDRAWAGGEAWVIPDGVAPAARLVSRLAAGEAAHIAVALTPDVPSRRVRVAVTDASGAIVLSRVLLSGPPNVFGGYVLEAGDLAAGGNDFGRLGRIAAFRGFEWRGTELLPAAALAVAAGGRLSDGIYVTALGRIDQKASAPAAETDWAATRSATNVEPMRAEYRFDDLQALRPIGLELWTLVEASDVADVGAVTVQATIRNVSGGRLANTIPSAFVDWDLAGGEIVRWSDELQALVAEPAAGGGPLTLLASEGTVVANASVPLGTPQAGGVYEAGSGVLVDTFSEDTKLDLVTGGGAAGLPGFATATDRAHLLSVGPFDLAAGESRTVRFWLLAAESEAAAASRLEALRAAPVEPPVPEATFRVEAPFPNPLRTGAEVMDFPYTVPLSARETGQTLEFEIYDVAGRRLVRQARRLPAAGELPPVTWDGRLSDGVEAASGAYLFVFRLGGETRSGRILIVH